MGFGNLFKSCISSAELKKKKNQKGDDDQIGQVILGKVGKKFEIR